MSTSTTHTASCILCGSDALVELQRLSARAISDAYRAQFSMQIDLPVPELRYLKCSDCDLRFFSPPVTGDEKFYAALQKISWYYSAAKQEFGIAAARVPADAKVLEIGSGRGLFARELRAASYTGLEFSPDAIEWAAKEGVRLLPETVEHHAQSHAGEYDAVCTFQVLEHVSDPRSFLQAALLCLRPGGRLIVSVPGEDSFAHYATQDVLNMPPHHVSRWTDRALSAIARVCNAKLVEIVPEPLGRNMRRPYAQAYADNFAVAGGRAEPVLLDTRLEDGTARLRSTVAARAIKTWMSLTPGKQRRGHAVVAVFEKLST